jgi:hypothetical protein
LLFAGHEGDEVRSNSGVAGGVKEINDFAQNAETQEDWRAVLVAYSQGEVIYAGKCELLYMVDTGRVKVSSIASDGYEAVVKICLGKGCLVNRDW